MADANGKRVLQLIRVPGNSVCADCKSDGKLEPWLSESGCDLKQQFPTNLFISQRLNMLHTTLEFFCALSVLESIEASGLIYPK